MTDQRLVADVKAAEGHSLTAYKDTLGYWTIGYGHLLQSGVDWTGHTITQETADQLLSMDLDEADQHALNLPEVPGLNACRTNAVIELVFNMGLQHWVGFSHCRDAIGHARWQEAHDQLLQSLWAKQVGPHRSQRIAGYLLTGAY